ncbi:MAG: hypothetical protein V4608_14655 [Bacteroidota bacterium]
MNNQSGFTSRITSPDGINYINIGLMLVSLLAAYVLPFELFLFSYAVLGPLHYLTEISWLEKKNYFIKSRKDIWIFVLLVLLITVGMFDTKAKTNLFVSSFMFSGFIYALIILFVEKLGVKLILVFATFVFSVVININTYPDVSYIIFAIWLPTIIHVFLFTGAFILYGALKSRSTSGIVSFLFFIGCAITFFIYMPENFGIPVSEYGKKAYTYFRIVNSSIYKAVGFGKLAMNDEALYVSTKAVAVMRFIAFAYTYHYLNWFSKTTVIKWNQISRKRMSVILILWIVSVALYIFSYSIGFYALFLLSMLHVFFEFPLNHQTFIGIGKEIKLLTKK